METLAALLRETELFGDLPEAAVRQMLPHGHVQEYRKGQFLIVPQQKVDQLGVVLTGKVHILHLFPDGTQSLTSHIREGGFVGADLVCTRRQDSPYHAMAVSAVRVFYLPAAILTRAGVLGEEARLLVLERLLNLISRENMKKEYRLAILSQKGLRERIMTYLVMQAGKLGKRTISVPFSREEMASFLCVNRSALSHELSKMEQEGLISFRKNVFTLLQWEETTAL